MLSREWLRRSPVDRQRAKFRASSFLTRLGALSKCLLRKLGSTGMQWLPRDLSFSGSTHSRASKAGLDVGNKATFHPPAKHVLKIVDNSHKPAISPLPMRFRKPRWSGSRPIGGLLLAGIVLIGSAVCVLRRRLFRQGYSEALSTSTNVTDFTGPYSTRWPVKGLFAYLVFFNPFPVSYSVAGN